MYKRSLAMKAWNLQFVVHHSGTNSSTKLHAFSKAKPSLGEFYQRHNIIARQSRRLPAAEIWYDQSINDKGMIKTLKMNDTSRFHNKIHKPRLTISSLIFVRVALISRWNHRLNPGSVRNVQSFCELEDSIGIHSVSSQQYVWFTQSVLPGEIQ